MQKTLISLILAFLICGVGYARPNILTHAQYAHLSDSQKNALVIKLMEMTVELESKYKHQVKTSGFNQERFEKYTKAMREIAELIINSAYAEDSGAWEQHAANFTKFLTESSDAGNHCIYAGWPSTVRNSTDQGPICLHPKNLVSGTAERVAYQDDTRCGGTNNITCNPAIFGYKKSSAQSVFCVKAGPSDSENSSLNCMKAALNPTGDADSKEERLEFLRKKLTENPSIYQGVQRFVAKSCICTDFKSTINKGYMDKIRPHRTCYGMMEMMANTIACDTETPFENSDLFKKIADFTTEKDMRSATNYKQIDETYTAYLGTVTNTPEYAQLCGGGSQTQDDNSDDQDKDEYVCKATCTPKAVAAATGEGNSDSNGPEQDSSGAGATNQEGNNGAGADQGDTTQSAATDESPYTCTFAVTKKGSEEAVSFDDKTATKVLPKKDETEAKLTAKFGDKEQTLTCSVEVTNPTETEEDQEDEKVSIKVSLADKTAQTAKVKAEPNPNPVPEGWIIKWHRKNFPGSGGATKPSTDSKPGAIAGDTAAVPLEDGPDVGGKPMTGNDNKTEIEEPRVSKDYQACAYLQKGNEKSEEDCVTIPKLDEVKPQTPATAMPQQGQQQQGPRRSSSTSALGIR